MQISNRLSEDARDLADLKYKEQAQEIDNNRKQNMARLSIKFARDPGLHNAIGLEFLAMAKEKGEAWSDLYVEAFVSENILPNAGELNQMAKKMGAIIERCIPAPFTAPQQIQDQFNSLPHQVYGRLKDKVRKLELEQKLKQRREEEVKQAVKTTGITLPVIDFSFITNTRIKDIIERDYAELQRLDPNTSPKSVLVISGSIMEGLILDALVTAGKWTFEQGCQEYLNEMIGAAVHRGIVKEDRLTDAMRKYRNLIHPGREIKYDMVFSESDANLARHAVDIIIRDVRQWHIKNP